MYGRKIEISVGVFMIMGMVCLVYLSVNLGSVELFGSDAFTIDATFGSIEGLEPGVTCAFDWISGLPKL